MLYYYDSEECVMTLAISMDGEIDTGHIQECPDLVGRRFGVVVVK